MKISSSIPLWKTAPFIRLLLPFIAGILIQWYASPAIFFTGIGLLTSALAFILFYYLPLSARFNYAFLQGVVLQLFILFSGLFICWQKDAHHQFRWYGNIYNDSAALVIRINEPPEIKTKTIKAEAIVEQVILRDSAQNTYGKLVIYFSKDSLIPPIAYGDRLLLRKPLQPIKSSGNPGAFDYKRYAAFQQLYHTVYLKSSDYILLHENKKGILDQYLFTARDFIITSLRENLPDNDAITGIAEALLIGYKADLDKDLVQAYTNAGVVHIIAISGLHLGLIYIMLLWLLDRLPYIKKQKLLKVVLTLSFLWLFSLLTGASASVLRSAVMFTCIIIGKNYFRQASIYNSLATSAFLLLCYDPYFLWDVGFQLSYFAVFGIVWLQKPIYHAWYIPNKWLNKIWEMAAVTIAAQLVTFPICLFYFHQFPNHFLLTNLFAVPLSTLILFAEIFLLMFAWLPFVATLIGKITYWLIFLMNYLILKCNKIPYSLIDNIYADRSTTFFLYLVVLCFCGWILYRKKWTLHSGMISLVMVAGLYSYTMINSQNQRKLIIYNVPKLQAIDFIDKNDYYFKGDSALLKDAQLPNFHLKPARIFLQATHQRESLSSLVRLGGFWQFGKSSLLIIDSTVSFEAIPVKIPVDVLLISKNPRIKISGIISAFSPSVVVFDGSNSLWKIAQWKKECEQVLLRCFSVADEGAYVLDVPK